jgi:hypothetical protein
MSEVVSLDKKVAIAILNHSATNSTASSAWRKGYLDFRLTTCQVNRGI